MSTSSDYVLPDDNVLLADVDQLMFHPEDMEMTPMEENIIFELANDDANANPVASSCRIVNQVESLQIDATVRRKSHEIFNNG